LHAERTLEGGARLRGPLHRGDAPYYGAQIELAPGKAACRLWLGIIGVGRERGSRGEGYPSRDSTRLITYLLISTLHPMNTSLSED